MTRRRTALGFTLAVLLAFLPAWPTPARADNPHPDAQWFPDAGFGLFVHWGIASVDGINISWSMRPSKALSKTRITSAEERERIVREKDYNLNGTVPRSPDQYWAQAARFNPQSYDPDKWLKAAKDAGFTYAVLTTRHHEGFALWPSDYGVFNTRNFMGGRDLVAPFVEACRRNGLKVGLYYSLIDWHHPSFPVDGTHPQRDDETFKAAAATRDIRDYQRYLHGQVRELLTGYGQIDYLFFDFSYTHRPDYWGGKGAADWDAENLLCMVRALQPHIIVNDRLGIPGDIVTPEQYQPLEPMTRDGERVAWEACQTLDGSWGYDRDNLDSKSPESLIKLLVDGVAKDGNLLLNVGPDGRGRIDATAQRTFDEIAAWMDDHARSIHGAGPAPWQAPSDTRYTLRGDRLYVHLFSWPFKHLHLPGLAGEVRYAQLMADASELVPLHVDPDRVAQNTLMGGLPDGTLTLQLPIQRPDSPVPVIELFLADAP